MLHGPPPFNLSFPSTMAQPPRPKRIPVTSPTSLGLSYYNSPFARPLSTSSASPAALPAASLVAATRAALESQHADADPYAAARTAVLALALSLGYDPATMVERGVVWAEDQDPFGHVTNTAFPRFFSACNYRVVEGFGRFVGRERGDDMRKGRGVCPLVKGYGFDIVKPVEYPDSVSFVSVWRAALCYDTRLLCFCSDVLCRRGGCGDSQGVYADLRNSWSSRTV
jgi:hypothetical protein